MTQGGVFRHYFTVLKGRPLLGILLLISLGLICGCLFLSLLAVFTHLKQNLQTQREQAFSKQIQPLLTAFLFQNLPAQAIWKQVSRHSEKIFLDLLYQYHQRLKGQAKESLGLLAEPYLQDLKAQFQDRQIYVRARALKLAALFQEQRFVPELLQGLEDPSPVVVLICFQILSQPQHPDILQPLIKSLKKLENLSAVYIASLLARKGLSLAPDLRALFSNPAENIRIRIIAAKTLLYLHDLQSISLALEILKQEEHLDIIVPALNLIEKLSPEDVSEQILPFAQSPQFAIRAYALRTLASLNKVQHSELFVRALEDASPWVTRQAALALKNTGQEERLKTISLSGSPAAEIAKQTLETL